MGKAKEAFLRARCFAIRGAAVNSRGRESGCSIRLDIAADAFRRPAGLRVDADLKLPNSHLAAVDAEEDGWTLASPLR